ncbi:MAG: hypothetical protein LBK54_00735 [Propionibacteriaceae bacterium]|jgi:hypothetical protein|nr:hypothetical protein [Propionibacteriaceae bacterium]
MALFGRKRAATPEWAGFLTVKEYNRFIEEVDRCVATFGVEYALGDGQLELADNPSGLKTINLINLAQLCQRTTPRGYYNVISANLGSILRQAAPPAADPAGAPAAPVAPEPDKTNFAVVRPILGVRLYNSQDLAQSGADALLLGRPLAGELVEVLVFDWPDTVEIVDRRVAEAWGPSPLELLELGRSNIAQRYAIRATPVESNHGLTLVAECEHFFAPNLLFELDRRPGLIGPHGSLVTAPTRHLSVVYPIADLRAPSAVTMLISLIEKAHRQGPGPLSRDLFWYRPSGFTPIPWERKQDKISVAPPAAFVAMLNQLERPSPLG